MIDLHSHILHLTDDGSSSIIESIKMAKEAYDSGFTTICCTPHYLEPQYAKTKKDNQQKLIELKEKLENENINIEILLGNEVFITNNMNEMLLEGKISTISNSDYLLFELPMYQKLYNAIDILRDFPNSNLILAHPERYIYVQDDIKYLDEFIDMGIKLQGNYESIIGKYGKRAEKTIKKLLKQKKIDFLATDCHHDNSTYSKMNEINKKLRKLVKEDYFEDLTLNVPNNILKNI